MRLVKSSFLRISLTMLIKDR
uniref:Uncharacterized protein n=1 Tax=Lepeophtheirus salmonis TaxID=72036 RepID=A0A0K2TK43_LEPSM